MLLYTETQLNKAYRVYRKHQAEQDIPFMSLENFRNMFENLANVIYTKETVDGI